MTQGYLSDFPNEFFLWIFAHSLKSSDNNYLCNFFHELFKRFNFLFEPAVLEETFLEYSLGFIIG